MFGRKKRNQKEIEQLKTMVDDLKKEIPSFSSIPVENAAQLGEMEASGITAVINIESGEFAGYSVVIRKMEVQEGGNIEVDYSAITKDGIEANKGIESVIGNLINYFLAKAALDAKIKEV